MIEYPDRYEAKIRGCMSNPCIPHRCPKCGQQVGEVIKKNGTRYLAEVEEEAPGCWRAWKTKPHFVECKGAPAPGVIVKGVPVKVVRGRKVPIGTQGVTVWIGYGNYGERIGLKDADGEVYWTALKNVEAI